MARVVAPWTWKRALRDHGPDECGFLLAMLMLNTYMDRNGYAYPSQVTWARAARMSVRMVQRHLARALRLGWLDCVNAGRTGQGWRHNGYRCSVPDRVELDEKDDELADRIASEWGDVESREDDDDSHWTPHAKRSDIAVSPRAGVPIKRDDTSDAKMTTNGAHGDDSEREEVTTQPWRTNSRSENSRSITHAQEEAPALARGFIKTVVRETKTEEIERRRRQAAEIVAAEEAKTLAKNAIGK